MKTIFVAQLPSEVQKEIKEKLQALGLNKEDVNNAMDSRLCDLEDTIDIAPYLTVIK